MLSRNKNNKKEEELTMINDMLLTFHVEKTKFQQRMKTRKFSSSKFSSNKFAEPAVKRFFSWLEDEGKEKYGDTAEWQAAHSSFCAFMASLEEIVRLMSQQQVDYANQISEEVVMVVADELVENIEKLQAYISKH